MREVVSVNIGGSGITIAANFWRTIALEHGIDPFHKHYQPQQSSSAIETYFSESVRGTYAPRTLFIDLNPDKIDALKYGKFVT